MPRIVYKKYKPQAETADLIDTVDDILREYADNGYDLTLRQLYYQMIARDLFPESWINGVYNHKNGLDPGTKNTQANYSKLGTIVSRAREGGLLDWDHVVDRGRSHESRPHWGDPKDFLTNVAPQFGVDLWEDQQYRVEVWVEKEALAGVVKRACRPYDVPYFPCKGYASASSIWDAAHNRILKKYHREHNQKVVILHLGDHDPSGIDMTRDIQERLDLFSLPTKKMGGTAPEIEVVRVALTMGQVEQYSPPPNPAKETDSRFAAYQAEHGDESWELDALEPSVLVGLIQKNIRVCLNEARFELAKEREEEYRQALIEMAEKWEE